MAESGQRGSLASFEQFIRSCTLNTIDNSSSSTIPMKSALEECKIAWQAYLDILNNSCAMGIRLANALAQLEQCCQSRESRNLTHEHLLTFQNHPTNYLQMSWTDFANATSVATATVKTHINSLMEEFIILEINDETKREHNESIILENAQTMMNVQHQFCAASCNAFSTLTCCLICEAPVGFSHEPHCSVINENTNCVPYSQPIHSVLRPETPRSSIWGGTQSPFPFPIEPLCELRMETSSRGPSPLHWHDKHTPLQSICEQRRGSLPNPKQLLSMKMPFYHEATTPRNFPLFPLNRRLSKPTIDEILVKENNDLACQMRSWSIPWEAWKLPDEKTVTWYQTRMRPKTNSFSEPLDCNCFEDDGVTEAIQLLSYRPIPSPTVAE